MPQRSNKIARSRAVAAVCCQFRIMVDAVEDQQSKDQALLPYNATKRRHFWTQPEPLGVVGTERRRLIDVEECGIELENTGGHISLKIGKPGHYTRYTKLTILMAIEAGDPNLPENVLGSVALPRHWIWVTQGAGTPGYGFAEFLEHVCSSIETHPAPGDVDDERMFLWDYHICVNMAGLVAQTVEARRGSTQFCNVHRPSYHPRYGPTAYIFRQLGQRLQNAVTRDTSLQELKQLILGTVSQLGMSGGFETHFIHCGYKADWKYPLKTGSHT